MKSIQECEDLIESHIKKKEQEEVILEKLMVGLREKTDPLLNERSKLEKELISLRKNVDQAQAAFNIAQSELKLYTSTESTEREKLEKLQNSLKSTVDTLAEKEQYLQSLNVKLPNSQQNLIQAQQALEEIKQKETKETVKLKQMRVLFEEQKSAMQASKSRNKIIDSLMREKTEGRITGIYGRLVRKLRITYFLNTIQWNAAVYLIHMESSQIWMTENLDNPENCLKTKTT